LPASGKPPSAPTPQQLVKIKGFQENIKQTLLHVPEDEDDLDPALLAKLQEHFAAACELFKQLQEEAHRADHPQEDTPRSGPALSPR
jgi:hypothetical protein